VSDRRKKQNKTQKQKKTKISALALMDAVAIFVPSRFIEIHRKSESWAWFERKVYHATRRGAKRTSQSATYANDGRRLFGFTDVNNLDVAGFSPRKC